MAKVSGAEWPETKLDFGPHYPCAFGWLGLVIGDQSNQHPAQPSSIYYPPPLYVLLFELAGLYPGVPRRRSALFI